MATSITREQYDYIIDSLNKALFEELHLVLQQHGIMYNPNSNPQHSKETTFVIWAKAMLDTSQDKTHSIPYGNTTNYSFSLSNTPVKKFTHQLCYQKEQVNTQMISDFKKLKLTSRDATQNNETKRQIAKAVNSIFHFYRLFFYNRSEICLAEMPIQFTITATGEAIVTYLPKLKNLRFFSIPLTGQYFNTKKYMQTYAQEIHEIQCELKENGFFRSQETTCN